MLRWICTVPLLALMAGCLSWEADAVRMRTENASRIHSYQDEAIINGILRERTIYPHHFYHDSAQLSELGKRDLTILATYLERHPGPLNIRQSGAPDDLYKARIAEVRDHLSAMGYTLDDLAVTDTTPGGDGIRSGRVYEIFYESDSGSDSQGPGAAGGLR